MLDLSDIHEQARYGNSVCFVKHEHMGAGRTKEEAIDNWREWTAFEYGYEWADWSRARHRLVTCNARCVVRATPCRRR